MDAGAGGEAGATNGGEDGGADRGGTSGTAGTTAQGGSAGLGTGGSAGTPGAGGEGNAAGTASASGGSAGEPALPTSCLYPTAPPPINRVTDYHLAGTSLEIPLESDCVFELGAPADLPLDPAELANMLFHYDVNGDGIEDPFFEVRNGGDFGQEFRLFLSQSDGDAVFFEATDCGLLLDAPVRSVFARYLNADGVPDLVVGTAFGIRIFLNLPDGLREVGSLLFDDPDASLALLDVAIGNWGTPELRDVFVGFDVALGGFELRSGFARFQARDGETEYTASTPLTTTGFTAPGGPGIESGYITSLPRKDRSDMFTVLLQRPGALGWLWDEEGTTIVPTPAGVSEETSLARIARVGPQVTLALGTQQDITFYALPERPSESPPRLITTALMAFPPLDRELGGGARRHSRFLVDLDADGDEDIVEIGRRESTGGLELVFQKQTNATSFEPQAPIATEAGWLATEAPFLPVYGRGGRIFVREAWIDESGPHAARVQALACSIP
jgi:hypothetical protein